MDVQKTARGNLKQLRCSVPGTSYAPASGSGHEVRWRQFRVYFTGSVTPTDFYTWLKQRPAPAGAIGISTWMRRMMSCSVSCRPNQTR